MASTGAIRGRQVYRGPRVVAHFDINYSGLAKVAMGPQLQHAVHDICEVAAAFAEFVAPIETGDYASSFTVDDYVETEIGGPPLGRMPRRGSRLVNTSAHAKLVEVGNQNFGGHRIFAKTLDAIEHHGEQL